MSSGDIRPSVTTVLPPSATRVKDEGRVAAATALAKAAMVARENFILIRDTCRLIVVRVVGL